MNGQTEYIDENLRKEQMLKLITKGFYREVINYGVSKKEVITISSFLLDCLMKDLKDPSSRNGSEYYSHLFTIKSVRDEWSNARELGLQEVSITELRPDLSGLIAQWLSEPAIRNSFIPAFPESAEALKLHFTSPGREYFAILYNGEPVGFIGADSIDEPSQKLEMKKLVGNREMQGRGIGKYATFLFLYHAFMIRGFDKVFIHSSDVNIRNIILNSKFGFELEGVFFRDVFIENARRDVVRMGLLKEHWMKIFSGPEPLIAVPEPADSKHRGDVAERNEQHIVP